MSERERRETIIESEGMRSMVELQRSLKAYHLLGVSLMLVSLLWLNFTVRASMADQKIVEVGVILDLDSALGKMVNDSLTFAIENYYGFYDHTTTKIDLVVRNVPQDDVAAAAEAGFDLLNNTKVHAILGPQNAEQAMYIVELGERFQKPVIWFPITGPSMLPPPSPCSNQGQVCFQFQAIADTMKALGWHSIVPIYEDTEYGSYLIPCLTNVLKDMGIQMVNTTAISTNSEHDEINNFVQELNNMRTHIFLVHLSVELGMRFIELADFHNMMGEGYAWILTQGLSSLTNPQQEIGTYTYYNASGGVSFTDFASLKAYSQGALGVRPVESMKEPFVTGWKFDGNFYSRYEGGKLTKYGYWSYTTMYALAMALEEAGTYSNGTKLRDEIMATNFTAYPRDYFDLRKGTLDQSKFEIYNVVGMTEVVIGSWSNETGRIVRNLSEVSKSSDEYPLLQGILWPGKTLIKPPKLRIGVPIRTNSFPEFVSVDNSTKPRPQIGGFVINVFLKAIDALPFRVNSYEFVPLPITNTIDNILCTQMESQDLDAMIGDLTIVAHRTKCVDFTFPILDSSVAMVVRAKNASTKGLLFKPFHWLLWLILGGIFVAAIIIVNMLLRAKISKFRFNPFLVYKIDVMDLHSASITAGWMVILSSFLFILVLQVYTANLASILTQGRIKEPSFKDEKEIKSRNLSVGYQSGSWVREFIIEQRGFESSQLKALQSPEEYDDALSKGTKHGGVDAIFDETPYLTLFLFKYKSRYMITGSIYKTGGFAFAFQKKSILVSHFSKAILKVMTEDVEPYRVLMAKSSLPTSMEDLEFEDQSDGETPSLNIADFGGLNPVLLTVVALIVVLSIPLLTRLLDRLRIKWSRRICF